MRIPNNVYLTRCRFCIHGRPHTENREIPEDKLFYYCWTKDAPCRIIGIAQCMEISGECLSFKPNAMFGICQFCAFNNPFCNGYCTFPGGPQNKRKVFLGYSCRGDYWSEHALSTCDRYQTEHTCKHLIMRNILDGSAPANFDPDTWEPLGDVAGTAAARRWEEMQAKRAAELAAERKKSGKFEDGEMQLSMFDAER